MFLSKHTLKIYNNNEKFQNMFFVWVCVYFLSLACIYTICFCFVLYYSILYSHIYILGFVMIVLMGVFVSYFYHDCYFYVHMLSVCYVLNISFESLFNKFLIISNLHHILCSIRYSFQGLKWTCIFFGI